MTRITINGATNKDQTHWKVRDAHPEELIYIPSNHSYNNVPASNEVANRY